jgi:hypothetical protein
MPGDAAAQQKSADESEGYSAPAAACDSGRDKAAAHDHGANPLRSIYIYLKILTDLVQFPVLRERLCR